MGVSAYLKNVRVSVKDARLVIDQIRGLSVMKALDILNFALEKPAALIKKVLQSAIANAEHNENIDVDQLKVSEAYVNQGSYYKRMQARAKGRGARILKPTGHIMIKVAKYEGKQ